MKVFSMGACLHDFVCVHLLKDFYSRVQLETEAKACPHGATAGSPRSTGSWSLLLLLLDRVLTGFLALRLPADASLPCFLGVGQARKHTGSGMVAVVYRVSFVGFVSLVSFVRHVGS